MFQVDKVTVQRLDIVVFVTDGDWQRCMWHLWSTTTGLWSRSRSWWHTKHWCDKLTVVVIVFECRTQIPYIPWRSEEGVSKGCKCRKRKAVNDEVDQLKKRKKELETDKESLLTSADECAEKAEKQHNVSFITKSNALRKAAKEKDSEPKLGS